MCGRFALIRTRQEIAGRFGVRRVVGCVNARYNIAPGTQVTVVRAAQAQCPREDELVRLDFAHWGFRPRGSGEKAPEPINARVEGVATTPYFRESFARRRCLIPADGWYEWTRETTTKQPFYIQREDRDLLWLAGIWSAFAEGTQICCAVLTEPARGVARRIHDRMPLALAFECWRRWLDPDTQDREALREAVERMDPTQLLACPVAGTVNDPRHEGPDLAQPRGEPLRFA